MKALKVRKVNPSNKWKQLHRHYLFETLVAASTTIRRTRPSFELNLCRLIETCMVSLLRVLYIRGSVVICLPLCKLIH